VTPIELSHCATSVPSLSNARMAHEHGGAVGLVRRRAKERERRLGHEGETQRAVVLRRAGLRVGRGGLETHLTGHGTGPEFHFGIGGVHNHDAGAHHKECQE
jgi:hypothetical protein